MYVRATSAQIICRQNTVNEENIRLEEKAHCSQCNSQNLHVSTVLCMEDKHKRKKHRSSTARLVRVLLNFANVSIVKLIRQGYG